MSLASGPPPTVMSPTPLTPTATPKVPAPISLALEEDLVVISAFFAAGGDDQTGSEEAVWAKLTSQVAVISLSRIDESLIVCSALQTPCQTEVTWEDFYQRHSEEVQRRYQNLIDAQAMAGQ